MGGADRPLPGTALRLLERSPEPHGSELAAMGLDELAAFLGGADIAHHADIHVLRYRRVGSRHRKGSAKGDVRGAACAYTALNLERLTAHHCSTPSPMGGRLGKLQVEIERRESGQLSGGEWLSALRALYCIGELRGITA